jgi:exonuclease VII large subunit
VLRRGYTITSRKKDGAPLRSAAELKPGDKIVTRFADGQTESVVEDTKQLSLFD